MPEFMRNALEIWGSLFANHAVLRTVISFAHVGGLLVGGGSAISADRQTLLAWRKTDSARTASLEGLRSAHGIVLYGLAAVIVSGFLLFAADSDNFWHSTYFWIKMGLFGLLMINGVLLLRAESAAERGDAQAWGRLTAASVASLSLWILTTLAGAALPNMG